MLVMQAEELLKKIKAEWERKKENGEALTPLEEIYLDAIKYVLGEESEDE